MSFKKITENVSNVSLLADQPSITPSQLKSEFDKGNETIKEAFNEQVEDLNVFSKNLAEEYDSTKTYSKGDLCLENNMLKQLNTDIASPESFDETKWNSVNLKDILTPAGIINQFAGENPPEGWLLCDGREISRIVYSKLFSVIGTMYGAGDGNTTFNLPDFKGKVPVGVDSEDTLFNTIGKAGGNKNVTGNYGITWVAGKGYGLTTSNPAYAGRVYVTPTGQVNDNASGLNSGLSTVQPYVTVNYIIKA